jgi:hypothetical protein
MKLKQYSIVKIKSINKKFNSDDFMLNKRVPKIGDIATIVEVYEKPSLGYELECSDKNGITEWLVTFALEDAEFELIRE